MARDFEKIAKLVLRNALSEAESIKEFKSNASYEFVVKDHHIDPVIKSHMGGSKNKIERKFKLKQITQYLESAQFMGGKTSRQITHKAIEFVNMTWYKRHEFWTGIFIGSLLSFLSGLIIALID